ncbi:MAG TPA: hypothetical protein VF178_09800 [Gemmatimonadaceae bacterium]
MPDETLEVAIAAVSGRWGTNELPASGVLRLGADAVQLVAGGVVALEVPYRSLSGASWRKGRLTLHGSAGSLVVEADRGLDRAWRELVSRACPVPEFTRGLRVLGSPRAQAHDSETRFFAPLIQARRRVEDEGEPERRVAAFAARHLVERYRQLLTTLATEAHPDSAPDRRALEAELFEATEALLARLDEVQQAAGQFEAASENIRFDQWRIWVERVAAVFAEADRSWVAMSQVLPPAPRGEKRRRWWRGASAVILIGLSAAMGMWP